MSIYAGEVSTLVIDRETEIGFMLTDGEEEVFMHKNEATEEVHEGLEVDVFVYQDHQGRLSATMSIPEATVDSFGWVEVVDVKEDLGLYVNIGVSKDVLLGKSDLPALEEVWPRVGDELYCTLKRTLSGRLVAKPANIEDLRQISVPATASMYNKNVSGRVYRTLYVGSFIITDERFLGFIHDSERLEEPRVGQKVTGRIIDIKEDGEINISLRPRKQEGMEGDALTIAEYMEGRGGAMPFWDKSDPEDIQNRFKMSKAAFKRALGKLYKEGKIYQEEGWTYFKQEEQEQEQE